MKNKWPPVWQTIVCKVVCTIVIMSAMVAGSSKRCWSCRSRSEYGDCRDPFYANANNLDMFPQVDASPCASGWCGKIIEGDDLQYMVATERLCLQRPPDDGEERCAETSWGHEKVYMCFCMGDLCNGSTVTSAVTSALLISSLIVAFVFSCYRMSTYT